jgi:hypothetical protein
MKNKLTQQEITNISTRVKKYVMFEFNLDLNSKSRKTEYVDARSIYYKILYDFYKLTYEEIASTVDKTHASVLNATSNFKYYIEQDKVKCEKYLNVLLALKLISEEEREYMKLSNKSIRLSKLYKLVQTIPDDKAEFFYQKIENLLKYY